MRHSLEEQKQLGAFYTPPAMAQKITDWALRSPADTMLDPSFGGLVFLTAAKERLLTLGADKDAVASQLYGVDLDPKAHSQVVSTGLGIRPEDLIVSDFFAVSPGTIPAVSANIGNPPYVRYQSWSDPDGNAAATCAAMGVKLTKLASLWAPFIVHGCRFLRQGGRMGQVLPAEILFAQYSAPVIDLLLTSFSSISLALFKERVFPGALEEVVLLFADGYGDGPAPGIGVIESKNLNDLDIGEIDGKGSGYLRRDAPLLRLITRKAQTLYEKLERNEAVRPLSAYASVNVGVVTGANGFFAKSRAEIGERGIAPELFKPLLSKAADVAGARLAPTDVEALAARGRPTELFVARPDMAPDLLATAADYLAEGESERLHERYKCRIRNPWWALPVPEDAPSEILLTYMNDVFPRLTYNEARVLTTNTIHNVEVADGTDARALVASFYNSLTLLSAEIVGRSYGGGTLKLEPTEAERILIPPIQPEMKKHLDRIDTLVRARDIEELVKLVDPIVLGPLGLGEHDFAVLRRAREKLFQRRRERSKA